MSKEAVEARVKEALKDFDPVRFFDNCPTMPDPICLNCGRSVMVGRCCDNPNVVLMERKEVSEEVWEQIQDIIKNPPAPTERLKKLMMRKKL